MLFINIWIGLLALTFILYVVLDGFSLGIALLFPFLGSEDERDRAMEAIAPVWDANQTWLVLGGGGLFVAFPLLYGVLFSALYIPLFTLLYGLIFRGVSFEFRANSVRKTAWNRAFFLGSLTAVVAQGFTLGGVLTGPRTAEGLFSGYAFDWFTPFSIAAALGLMAGYVLLGACYLIIKTEGTLRDRAFKQAFRAALAVLLLQFLMIAWTPFHYPGALQHWQTAPRAYFIWIFPLLTLLSFAGIIRSLKARRETAPFVFSVVFFLAGYLALFATIFPYAIPEHVTFYQAAAEQETLRLTFWATLFILPVVLAYTIYSYWVFRGKVGKEGYYH